jgi:hypothetical protein
MEKLILDIILKVRSMYRYDMDYNAILSKNPSLDVYLEDNQVLLRSVRFGNYDEICVYKDKIKFISADGKTERVLCEYENFEELITM